MSSFTQQYSDMPKTNGYVTTFLRHSLQINSVSYKMCRVSAFFQEYSDWEVKPSIQLHLEQMVKKDWSHTFTCSHLSLALHLINHVEKIYDINLLSIPKSVECFRFSKKKFSLCKHHLEHSASR
jgi:hypothetical protein